MPGKISISRTLEGSLLVHVEGIDTITLSTSKGDTMVLANRQEAGDYAINAVVLGRRS